MESKKITIRVNGKCHPAIQFQSGDFMVTCNCPGSKNGALAARAGKISDGHDTVNCRK